MKVLILAAGYGTRLAKDLEQTGQFPELKGVPKPLLPIAGHPLVSHWMDIIQHCPHTSDAKVYVVVNEINKESFQKWAYDYPNVKLVSDGTTCNEQRLGAVASMELAINHFKVQDDITVIGGDTLFFEDFSFKSAIDRFNDTSCSTHGGAVVLCYQCEDSATSKVGILEVNESGCVTSFLEKPSPDSTSSRNACPCFYIFSSGSLSIMKQFLEEKKNAPLVDRDATGNYVKYLCSKRSVFIFNISGRYDVGNLESYIACNEQYKAVY